MTKTELRTRFRKIRQDFVSSLEFDRKISAEKVLADRMAEALIATGTIGGYDAMAAEIDPAETLSLLAAKGHAIALPWFENREAKMAFKIADGNREKGPFGILQPGPESATTNPDTLLVPLVAVDLSGNRIGQGKGHYDRAIAEMRKNRQVRTIGLAWECQIADALPADSWDEPLDYIATPERIIVTS